MRYVPQRIIDAKRGDCMTACIATLLGLPYEDVPTWVADAFDRHDIHEGYPEMLAWIRERGWHLRTISWRCLNDFRGLEGVLCIASVPSQKFPATAHAVIGTWRQVGIEPCYKFHVEYDPNPGNGPWPDFLEPWSVSFFIPRDPAHVIFVAPKVR